MEKIIIWIDRGIIISLIYILLKTYNKVKDKYLIVRQNRIRNFLSFLFPKLNFIANEKDRYSASNDSESDEDHKDYMEIFIRSTPTKGSNRYIVVDYIWNYNKIIPTKEIWLVPYYDKNDPLFFYLYDPKNDDTGSKIEDSNDSYLKVLDQYKIINHFTLNKRSNFKLNDYSEEFSTWDLFFETGTIQRFLRNGDVQKSITVAKDPLNQFLFILNKYLNNVNFLNDYTIPKPTVVYNCPKPQSQPINITYPIANLNQIQSFGIDTKPIEYDSNARHSKERIRNTRSIIKIIDKEIDKSSDIVIKKPLDNSDKDKSSEPIINVPQPINIASESLDSYNIENLDQLFDLFNEKIESLIKIF